MKALSSVNKVLGGYFHQAEFAVETQDTIATFTPPSTPRVILT